MMPQLSPLVGRLEFAHGKGDPTIYTFYGPAAEQSFKEPFEAFRADGNDLEPLLRLSVDISLWPLEYWRHDEWAALPGEQAKLSPTEDRRPKAGAEFERLSPGRGLRLLPRDFADGILPKTVTYRTDKMGLTTPVETLVNHSSGPIREKLMNSRFRAFRDLKKMDLTAESRFSREVFGLLILDLRLNRYAVNSAHQ